MRARFGVDLDGVVYRWDETVLFLLRHYWDIDLPLSTHWNFIKENVPKEAWRWLWNEGVTQHGMFRHGHLETGAKECLEEMAEHGDIFYVTHRPLHGWRDTIDFLDYHRLPGELVQCPGKPKSTVWPPCDMYVDDSLKNVKDLRENTNASVLVFDQPWNREEDVPGVLRVHSWPAVRDWTILQSKWLRRKEKASA